MLLIGFGTRPEWLKLLPLFKKLDKEGSQYKTLFTGQHSTLIKKRNFDFHLTIKGDGNRLDAIVSSVLERADGFLKDIDHVLVHGDTSSAYAVALAAFHRNIPIIHLEAGLRSFDIKNPYPEEFNRASIDAMAKIFLCPTRANFVNIVKQRPGSDGIFLTGNTVLDNLAIIKASYQNKVLITLHRRENHANLHLWFRELDKLAVKHPELEFILPIHPNPKVMMHKNLLKHVNVVEPMHYKDLLQLLASCKLVITDSGGIQEEGSFFKKRVIVCRKETERQESIGLSSELCCEPSELKQRFEHNLALFELPDDYECPFGDGHACEKIYKIFKDRGIV